MKVPAKPIMVGVMLLAASTTCLTGCVKDNPKSQLQSSYMQSHADMYGPAPTPDVHSVILEPSESSVENEDGVSD